MMKKHLFLMLIVLVTVTGRAHAQSCSPSVTTPITFTSVNPLASGTYNTTATLSVTCSGYLLSINTFCFTIGAGSGGTNSNGQRLLAGPSGNTIPFQLFQDSGRTVPWPVGTPVHLPANLTGNGTVTFTIYLSLYMTQSTLPTGTYSSTFSGSGALLNYGLLSGFLNCTSLLGGSSSTSFTVQTTLSNSCLLNVTGNVNFGTIASLTATLEATGSLSVQCTNTTAFNIGLDNGQGSGVTSPSARKMTGPGGATLTYGLYQNSACSVVWGNTLPPGGNTQSGTGTGNAASYTVYGCIPPQTKPAAGTYTDTIAVTVSY